MTKFYPKIDIIEPNIVDNAHFKYDLILPNAKKIKQLLNLSWAEFFTSVELH